MTVIIHLITIQKLQVQEYVQNLCTDLTKIVEIVCCNTVLQDETAAVFERLNKHFAPETVVVLIRYNNNRNPDTCFGELDFVHTFQLKDIDSRICKKQ